MGISLQVMGFCKPVNTGSTGFVPVPFAGLTQFFDYSGKGPSWMFLTYGNHCIGYIVRDLVFAFIMEDYWHPCAKVD